MREFANIVLLSVVIAVTCACNDMKDAPKGIDADGTIYIACKGYVAISGNMQQGYEVRFTDASGLDHDVRGILKLEVSDLPDVKLCKAAESKSNAGAKEDGVSEECNQARANGTALKWNDGKKQFDVNPVCRD
jgi:hypothetical protein